MTDNKHHFTTRHLERCGLIRDGQATRRGRFLYLDDATI